MRKGWGWLLDGYRARERAGPGAIIWWLSRMKLVEVGMSSGESVVRDLV